ncbi:hypothetical protein [Leucobacter sp. HY1910]
MLSPAGAQSEPTRENIRLSVLAGRGWNSDLATLHPPGQHGCYDDVDARRAERTKAWKHDRDRAAAGSVLLKTAPTSAESRKVNEVSEIEAQQPCPHALHTMLASPRIREMVGDPSKASPAQAAFVLTECKFPAGHRGAHRSVDGKVSWTGKLSDDEMAFAEVLRAARGEEC